MQQAQPYTMRNYFDAVEAGKASVRNDRQFAQQDQINQMKIAQMQQQQEQANALNQMDPTNLDPNKLWEAGQHDMAIKLVQNKIDTTTGQLQKIGRFFRENVKDQASYDKALQFVRGTVPDADKYLANIPTVYDPEQVSMFVSYVDQAVATKPKLETVKQADGTIKVVDISKSEGQVVGGTPESKPSSVQEYEYAKSQGYKGSYQQWQNTSGSGGMTPYQNWQIGKDKRDYGDKTSQRNAEIQAAKDMIAELEMKYPGKLQALIATNPDLSSAWRLSKQPLIGTGSSSGGTSFSNAAEANAAIKAGKVKKGQRITVGGRSAIVP